MITHLACQMDGNRRWATQQGLQPWLGHRAGAKRVEVAINFCLQYKISYLSLYTFSLENFKRSEQERSFIFDLVAQQSEANLPTFIKQGIKIKFVGNLLLFPESIQQICKRVEEQTAHCTNLQVNFMFGYGARQEIFAAAQSLVKAALAGAVITQEMFESHLWTAGIPDPEVVIKTGGARRLSNFLLYQSSYSEIRFLDTFWPDLTEQELFDVVSRAVQVQKNVGK